ncbi:MAG: hypothetical protein EP297_15460 [Gammaproteobacteria bacterium]|nr:MAG: hypothetical protein EP297_15460 [Gammaproteobacteria bacterium]
MNPLKTVTGTLVTGLVLAIIFTFLFDYSPGKAFNYSEFIVWVHVFVGIIWIGLLYYFNFVQVQALAAATADSDGPGPAAIGKYVAPRALLWFRWAALITWLTGVSALGTLGGASAIHKAFMLQDSYALIGMGAWMGTIMLFNVWVLIWPNQKKVLGLVEATDEEKAKAKGIAFLASRTNTMLSIPMLLGMTAWGHGPLL